MNYLNSHRYGYNKKEVDLLQANNKIVSTVN